MKKKLPPPLPLAVTGFSADGGGVARLPDGMTCFVAGALPGETCLVQLDKVGKSMAWGHVKKIMEPSPDRVTPDCPYFSACGGCALRHMTYEAELAFKAGKVRDCLARIGGWDPGQLVIHGADNTQRYRNKVQFPISAGAVGFYAQGTHRVTDVDDCLLQPRPAARLRGALLEYMRAFSVSCYDEKNGTGLLRHLYVRTNRAGESLCCVLINGKSLPHEPELVDSLRAAEPGLRGVVLGINEKKNNVILGDAYRTLWGDDFLMDEMCGLTFKLSVPSFYQVNTPQAERLYGIALDCAALTGAETALDLYCGIGTITLCLAKKARRVIGAEIVPEAIEDAKENARRNGIENAEFFCGDASDVAAKLAADGVRPEVITVDPPRKGLAEDVVSSIAEMSPSRVVYVSCDPATLARDVKRFSEKGYRPIQAEAVDLFPRTPHVETVCLLVRAEGADT